MYNIIPRIFRTQFFVTHSFANIKKFGIKLETLPTIPKFDFPVRPRYQQQDDITKQDIYKYIGYKKKEYPRCRYMAFHHKGKIYHIFDASRIPLGRMCTTIARQIRGKNSPLYRNNIVNPGATCIIVNGNNPLLTGKKLLFKKLRYHTGFIGHLRTYSYKDILLNKPQLLYHYIVKTFLPKNSLSVNYLNNIHIFRGNTHDFKFLPQFAPDENIYQGMPEIDFRNQIFTDKNAKIIAKIPGATKNLLGKQISQQSIDPASTQKAVRYRSIQTKKQMNRKIFQHKRNKYRYKVIRAIKIKKTQDSDFIYLDDQRKAKKMDLYAAALDEDAPQEDEQIMKQVWTRKNKKNSVKGEEKVNSKQQQGKKGGGKQGSKKK